MGGQFQRARIKKPRTIVRETIFHQSSVPNYPVTYFITRYKLGITARVLARLTSDDSFCVWHTKLRDIGK